MKRFEINGVEFLINDQDAKIRVLYDDPDVKYPERACGIDTARKIYKAIRDGKICRTVLGADAEIMNMIRRNEQQAKTVLHEITVRAKVIRSICGGITYFAKIVLEDQEKLNGRYITVYEQSAFSADVALKKLNDRLAYANVRCVQMNDIETVEPERRII